MSRLLIHLSHLIRVELLGLLLDFLNLRLMELLGLLLDLSDLGLKDFLSLLLYRSNLLFNMNILFTSPISCSAYASARCCTAPIA